MQHNAHDMCPVAHIYCLISYIILSHRPRLYTCKSHQIEVVENLLKTGFRSSPDKSANFFDFVTRSATRSPTIRFDGIWALVAETFKCRFFVDRISEGSNAIASVRPSVRLSPLHLWNRLTVDVELLHVRRS